MQIKQYADEVRERWGDTEAYRESERRTANYSQSDWDALYDGMDAIMAGFAELKADGASPGQMYVADERFTKNIDKHCDGTATYIGECINSYCG